MCVTPGEGLSQSSFGHPILPLLRQPHSLYFVKVKLMIHTVLVGFTHQTSPTMHREQGLVL